jgi:hypothetical protein
MAFNGAFPMPLIRHWFHLLHEVGHAFCGLQGALWINGALKGFFNIDGICPANGLRQPPAVQPDLHRIFDRSVKIHTTRPPGGH